jgi:hypothetical protein
MFRRALSRLQLKLIHSVGRARRTIAGPFRDLRVPVDVGSDGAYTLFSRREQALPSTSTRFCYHLALLQPYSESSRIS